jgi:exodeoxyribonuclease VII large subunit
LFAFCDESLCRTVALLRVPVISSVGHHTDRTLIDDVAAVCCSTPTHAAEAAVPIDCAAARTNLTAAARRLHNHGRNAITTRARVLERLAAAPGHHVARERHRLHQLLRELRASARRGVAKGGERAGAHAGALARATDRAHTSERAARARDLERLALALAAHDPDRTLARGYALVEDRTGEPLTNAGAARDAHDLRLRFNDGTVDAEVSR